VFDVIAENTVLLPAHDVAAEVGSLAADQHTFTLQVTDGQLNIRFARRGFAPPIVNAIRGDPSAGRVKSRQAVSPTERGPATPGRGRARRLA
jgi:hypothetical protein